MTRILDGLSDPVLWAILGWGAAVFVAPAVAMLLARDILRRHQREREVRLRRLRGFEVKSPRDPT